MKRTKKLVEEVEETKKLSVPRIKDESSILVLSRPSEWIKLAV